MLIKFKNIYYYKKLFSICYNWYRLDFFYFFLFKNLIFFKKSAYLINNIINTYKASKKLETKVYKNYNNIQKIVDFKKLFLKQIIESRSQLNFFYFFNKKSKKLSKIIWNLKIFSKKYYTLLLNNTLFFILLKSNFIFSDKDYNFLLKFKLIYINKNAIKKLLFFVQDGSLIELVLNKYYIYYLLSRFYNFNKNLKKFIFKKQYPQKLKSTNLKKNKINLYSFLRNQNNISIEVDFFSFSIFYFLTLKLNKSMSIDIKYIFFNYYLTSLLNWKYLN